MRPAWYTAELDRIGFTDHLSVMQESPLAYAASQEERARPRTPGERRKALASQRVGCATHALLLEGGRAFERGYVVTGVQRRDGTAAFEAVKAHAGPREILSQSEYDKALSVGTSVRALPWVAKFIDAHRTDGWQMVVEQPLRWSESVYVQDRPAVVPLGVDPWEGIEQATVDCKGIADALAVNMSQKRGVIIDAKEVPTTSLRPLFAHLERRLYHVQAAQYLAGASALLPAVSWDFYWLCYQGKAPHDAVIVRMSEDDREYGARVRTDLLRRIIEHRRTGDTSGRHTEVVESSLPAWETRDSGDVEEEW